MQKTISQNTIKKTKCFNLLAASIENLFTNQQDFDITEFSLKTLEILMYLERKQYLHELATTQQDKKDIGNGSYPRHFSCLNDKSLLIHVPRTRSGIFSPVMLSLLDKNKQTINRLALALYKKGLSGRDISALLQEFYGENMSYAKVSNLAEEFHGMRKTWEKQPLNAYYKIIYCDCQYQTLRRGNEYTKEAIHLIYGVDENNYRRLLHLSVNPTESSKSWRISLEDIENRGVKNIDLVIADGVKGLENELFEVYPNANLQKCVTHKKRSILLRTRPKEKAEMAKDLREVFDHFNEESSLKKAKEKLEVYIEKWEGRYPNLRNHFNENELSYYFTYLKYAVSVRRYIYTSNSIENLHRQIRKATKHKISFEKEERLLDYIFIVIRDYEKGNWGKYPISQFEHLKRIKTQLV